MKFVKYLNGDYKMKKHSAFILIITLFYINFSFANENYIDSKNKKQKSEISVSGQSDIIITNTGQKLINTINGHANVSMTRIGKNGKLETFCTSSQDQINRFHAGESLESIQGKIK